MSYAPQDNNIVLKFDSSGRPIGAQLIDFGIACQKDDGSFHQRSTSQENMRKRLNSRPWIAPELYASSAAMRARNSVITDVYSVGYLLWRLLDRMSDDFIHKSELQKLMRQCMSEEPGNRMSLSFLLVSLKPMLDKSLCLSSAIPVIIAE